MPPDRALRPRLHRSPRADRLAGRRVWIAAFAGVALRPRLWGTAARSAARLARPGWWRRPPFLPVPDRAYLRFRLETQYGRDGAPDRHDLVTYLEWCRTQEAIMRRSDP